jgi:hypothetical protein
LLFLFAPNRHYKDINDQVKNVYHKAVTASDEAFIWQIMTFYPDFWLCENKADEEDSVGKHNNGKGGPRKGFKDTAGKTVETYGKYCKMVGESRSAANSKLWGDRLMLVARQFANTQKKKETGTVETPPIVTITIEDHLLMYTSLDLCAMEETMFEEDHPSTDTTATEEL